MSPLELRSALAVARSEVVVIDYTDDADSEDLDRDDIAYEDMDGEEIESDGEAHRESALHAMGELLDSGVLKATESIGPFINPSSIYCLCVAPTGAEANARCHFEPPSWFGRVHPRGRDKIQRLVVVIRAIATMLSDEFASFLSQPSPETLADCEWQFLDSTSKSIAHTLLLRKGLVRRLNDRLNDEQRVDASALGALLPYLWLLWPYDGPPGSNPMQPLALPLSAIYEPTFRMRAAARLCTAGFTDWLLDEASKPASWNGKAQARRPFRNLDQQHRLHLLAALLRIPPAKLLAAILEAPVPSVSRQIRGEVYT